MGSLKRHLILFSTENEQHYIMIISSRLSFSSVYFQFSLTWLADTTSTINEQTCLFALTSSLLDQHGPKKSFSFSLIPVIKLARARPH